MTEITLNFKYSEEEYKEAIRNYYAHAFRTKVDSIISVIVIIAGILCWVYLGYSIVYLLLICVGILLLLIILFVTYIQPGMFFRRQPKLRDEYVLNFNESGIDFKTEHLNSKIEWNYYKKIWENEKFYFLFYGANMMFTIIPKRVFENKEQEEAFRKLLSEKISNDFKRI